MNFDFPNISRYFSFYIFLIIWPGWVVKSLITIVIFSLALFHMIFIPIRIIFYKKIISPPKGSWPMSRDNSLGNRDFYFVTETDQIYIKMIAVIHWIRKSMKKIHFQPLGGAQGRSKRPNRPKIKIFLLQQRPANYISKWPLWSTESTWLMGRYNSLGILTIFRPSSIFVI